MVLAPVNATFATPGEWQEASRGVLNLVEVKILPATCSRSRPDPERRGRCDRRTRGAVAWSAAFAGASRILSRSS
jgi:hypothetical protein